MRGRSKRSIKRDEVSTPHRRASQQPTAANNTETNESDAGGSSIFSSFPIYQTPTVETMDISLLSSGRSVTSAGRHGRHNSSNWRGMGDRGGTISQQTTPLKENLFASSSINSVTVRHPSSDPLMAKIPSRIPTSNRFAAHGKSSDTTNGKSTPRVSSKRLHRGRESNGRELDSLKCEIRTVSVVERSAFASIPPPSLEEWTSVSEEHEGLRKVSMRKRLSPSLQHLRLLHEIHARTKIRHVSFPASLDYNAGFPDDEFEVDDDSASPSTFIRGRRRTRNGYRPLNPVKATRAILPDTPPMLSNKKHRLPFRCDVGFPGSTSEQIQTKQHEIRKETMWEEASPRLIVLLPSDSFGSAVRQDEFTIDIDDKGIQDRFNQGGWEGLPFCGPELVHVKERNARHFGVRRDRKSTHVWKPNPYSMLAPPLGSTPSSQIAWRPRPFYDRPYGRHYLLACITNCSIEGCNGEPLIVAVSLYRLPRHAEDSGVFGKMSEDFYVPAGDWEGKSPIELWKQRKPRGLFAYHPSSTDKSNLYLVLQVLRIGSPELHQSFDDDSGNGNRTTNASRKGLRRRISSKIGKSLKRGLHERFEGNVNVENTEATPVAGTDSHGSRFLTPVCFGLVPFHNKDENVEKLKWPTGVNRNVTLYAYARKNESETEFVDRLAFLANDNDITNFQHATLEQTNENDAILSPRPDGSKRKGIFKSPKLLRSVSAPTGPQKAEHSEKGSFLYTSVIPGTASVFVSDLGVDLTQSMLVDPPELRRSQEEDDDVSSRFMVDVTGDCAIALGTQADVSLSTIPEVGPSAKRRSNLVRLPPNPLGYVNDGEVREIQYLPPRPPKHYDVDIPANTRSILNLMFIYPRVLKLSESQADRSCCYSVRVRLVRSVVTANESTGKVETVKETLDSFYTITPWEGSQMTKEVFTKVYVCESGVILIREEFKLKLPVILDGSFFLQFTLYEIEPNDEDEGSIRCDSIADTLIPLSSSANRESSSGVRVTTVIPNGLHRLKLGGCQLQFETRLVSSIHFGDPTACTIVRDFPYAEIAGGMGRSNDLVQSLALTPSRSIVGSSTTSDPLVDIRVTFKQLFATASESTLVGNFGLFVQLHLGTLASRCRRDLVPLDVMNDKESSIDVVSEIDGFEETSPFLEETLLSLIEVAARVKQKLAKGGEDVGGFLKDYVDAFDEGVEDDDHESEKDRISEVLPERSQSSSSVALDSSSKTLSPSDTAEMETDDLGGAVTMKSKDPLQADINERLSRTISAVSTSGIPFSRRAFGASKMDKMRLEAELNQEVKKLTHLIDDEETVFSSLNQGRGEAHGSPARVENETSWLEDEGTVTYTLSGGTTIEQSVTNEQPSDQTTDAHGIGSTGIGIARRVRTAAETMIAPCIGPSLANLLSGNSGRGSDVGSIHSIPAPPKHLTDATKKREKTTTGDQDSDAENDMKETEVIFRHEENSPFIQLTIFAPLLQHTGGKESRNYVYCYEALLSVWAKAWKTQKRSQTPTKKDPMHNQHAEENDALMQGILSQIDLLLPLCLKSMSLRFSRYLKGERDKVILDEAHVQMIENVLASICHNLMNRVIGDERESDDTLLNSLSSVDVLIDFYIGLLSTVHSQQCSVFLTAIFRTLRKFEKEKVDEGSAFVWDARSIKRVKCSRQLRLRAVERISMVGPFIPLNFPSKGTEETEIEKLSKPNWLHQGVKPYHTEGTGKARKKHKRLPCSGWLLDLLANECLDICTLSCEAVVAEAIAHAELAQQTSPSTPLKTSALKNRPGKALKRKDLLLFQSIAIHSVTCLHEMLVRRQTMDMRYQSDLRRSRIATLFAPPILTKSLSSTRWLARMESTHKVRCLWLVCFVYILQETPATTMRAMLRSYCQPPDFSIHRFVRLLRLSCSTFQCLVDEERLDASNEELDLSPWLLQESFNTLCASTTVVVDECSTPLASFPREQRKLAQAVLDLLLHVLTVPQSAVTHLRTVGGAIQSLMKFGLQVFLDVVGDGLQHWVRIMLTLMNSISLSVRSISVDFILSLLSDMYKMKGNIDDISILMATVLPEVSAREMALYSVSGLIKDTVQIESAVWPLRRSFADIEEANPLDDDRIDPQLLPSLQTMCRTCQAIIDGVLIEMRLKGDDLSVVGSRVVSSPRSTSYTFDADEESLFEAASFFPAETAPMQRLRWLSSLKSLHESKGQWVEAAETLFLCARTISDSLQHLRTVWRPSEFVLWHDDRRSLWLQTIGKDESLPDRGNVQVMEFAGSFLEPSTLFGHEFQKQPGTGKFVSPTIVNMSKMLGACAAQAVKNYVKEDGMEELAYSKLESLLRLVMGVIEGYSPISLASSALLPLSTRRRLAEEEAALRKVSTSMNAELSKLAERLVFVTEVDKTNTPTMSQTASSRRSRASLLRRQYYVRVILSGTKPPRFAESTTIPTFLEWDAPCICRIPKSIVSRALESSGGIGTLENRICTAYAQPLYNMLSKEIAKSKLVMKTAVNLEVTEEVEKEEEEEEGKTLLLVSLVHTDPAFVDDDLMGGRDETGKPMLLQVKRFFYRKATSFPLAQEGVELSGLLNNVAASLVEVTVAHSFPCALSRQRIVITSEIMGGR